MGEMTAANINSFTEPNLRAKMTGKVERVYFNINGDNYQSNIDMKMKYNDFKIAILNKDSKKNKFFPRLPTYLFLVIAWTKILENIALVGGMLTVT